MIRTIAGFHQDQDDDWVAELSCFHNQHVRHQPPFQQRPWVATEEGRAERIGAELECPLCDRAELPADLTLVRTAGPFDETTIPEGLRRSHRVAPGLWALLMVADGSLDFSMDVVPALNRRVVAGQSQAIPPDVVHQVTVNGPVRLQVEFLKR